MSSIPKKQLICKTALIRKLGSVVVSITAGKCFSDGGGGLPLLRASINIVKDHTGLGKDTLSQI